jgi:hypothetical protein
MENEKKIEWTLRVAMFGEFLGHGIFAIQLKTHFLEMLTAFTTLSGTTANYVMTAIGILDVLVAITVLFYPFRLLLIYGAVWAFLTALARPIAGDSFWDFVERWANVGVPLALLWLRGWPKTWKELWS